MKLCAVHKRGVGRLAQTRPFFVAGCAKCEEKRAAGKVTGAEAGPPAFADVVRVLGSGFSLHHNFKRVRLERLKGRHFAMRLRGNA